MLPNYSDKDENEDGESNSTISLGSSLSPINNSYWLSSSGQFAFGFYKKENGFFIGIWFEKIQQKTVIWTANRDDPPLLKDVKLILTINGSLVLQSEDGQQTSLLNAPLPAFSASMLNTGNFVLYSSDSRIIWESFGVPTDTLLPGQRLLPLGQLVSNISGTNHGRGNFQLIMQPDGNLVQYPANAPIAAALAYWYSKTDTAGDNVTLNLDVNGQLYLLKNTTGIIIKNFTAQRNSSGIAFYRLTIDFDGILRLYSHSWNQSDDWVTEWASTTNRCDPIGLCGVNSYCTLMDQEPICVCSRGFDFNDQKMNNLGCKRNSITNGCMSKNGESFDLQELEAVAWEDNPYSTFPSTKAGCRDDCLRDCNCEAAVFKDQQCSKQKLPLRFGRRQEVGSGTTIIKVGFGSSDTRNASRGKDFLIGSFAVLAFALIVLAVGAILIFRSYRVWKYKKITNHGNDGLIEDVGLRSYTYDELEKATNGFTDEVGKGAFGTVFKGVLSNCGGVVAIKRLEKVVAEGEREFRNEMKSIGRTHHKNLVKLFGYCHDGTHRLLVYEYMSNGSLADFLFKSERKPSWEEKSGIALNIARGILYLHEECETQIIHCDIKPENILMDEHKCTKIADFGLAKLLMPNQTRTYTGIRGTRGYVAPEWHRNLPITVKADVYSFGVMLMEIICGRRNVDMDSPEDEVILADWVYDCFAAGELDKLVKDEEVDKNKLQRMVRIGIWCIQDEPSFRPSMKKVVLMLEGTVEIPAPPSPTSIITSIRIN
ncbi:G-type lectin S-receptor-like serine/threonine-protein kinase LECRK2 [Corylus avellana]|uniref:G-type lectin S-receptor-like serine/threonine-protein kinase LECRK2 n=1 Tax=Corylus avellana TaxID=13451 RepID=UPI00286CC759|nr:G-type lectin S-receptor-like serine/threonine-protein kinase LECRK2 [Corylus avellana]